MWLIVSQPKIFNPKIEEGFSCIENNCVKRLNVIIQSDADYENSTIKLQPSSDDTPLVLSILSNTFTALLKKFYFSPEKTSACADCNNGHESDSANLCESDDVRGPNKPPKKGTTQNQPSNIKQSNVKYFNDNGANDNCNHYSYCATSTVPQITLPMARPTGLLLNSNHFAGDDCEGDNPHAAGTMQSIHKADPCNVNLFQNNSVGSNEFPSNSNQIISKTPNFWLQYC